MSTDTVTQKRGAVWAGLFWVFYHCNTFLQRVPILHFQEIALLLIEPCTTALAF